MKNCRTSAFLLAVILLSVAASNAVADVQLDRVFGDHMVLQRDMVVPVWGTADPGETVTVTFRDQQQVATPDQHGKWMVKLQPLKVGEPAELVVAGENSITLEDVLVGEVWVGSGQSNMAGGTAVAGVDQFTMMGALIRGWRDVWGQGDFPFLYVQKPSGGGCAWETDDPVTRMADAFAKLPATPNKEADGLYRELHIKIMQHPNTAMVTASDLGSGVHPLNKSGYGRRACHVALGFVYDFDVETHGPIYESHAVEGNGIRIRFNHIGQGLAFRHGDKLQGFEIAGDDGVYRWADAEIDGDTVFVSSKEVAKPVCARYGWSRTHTWANLFNKDGLPALTFQTE